MQVNSEDVTVSWGQQPHPFDSQYGKWRLAVFQDVQESFDSTKLYFLYDPEADEQSGTSGQRKGYPGLVIFDLNLRCFAGEIPLENKGKPKFLFALKCPSKQGGSSFILVTEDIYDEIRVNMFRVDLSQDGLSVAGFHPLLNQPIDLGGEYICSMRDDSPEIVVMANPGLQIWRINCMVEGPQAPIAYHQVQGADLCHFYDGFLSGGKIIFLSATPDGHFDNSRVHLLSLENPQHITTQNCSPDPSRGMPVPRKQCGIDAITNAILFAGGEVDRGYGNFERLVDYWFLDMRTFQWTQVPATMSCPLIEPRLTSANSGNIYVWGDFDQPLPGMPPSGTHLRILRVTGLEKSGHPPAYSAYSGGAPPAYPTLDEKSGPPYPDSAEPRYPQGGQSVPPPYPTYNPNDNYGNAGYQGGPAQFGHGGQYPSNPSESGEINIPHQEGSSNAQGVYQQTSDGQTAFYPSHNQKKKKDCVIQ